MKPILTNHRVDQILAYPARATHDEIEALAREVAGHRAATNTVVETRRRDEIPAEGDLVEVEWEGTRRKRAIYVRELRTGAHSVRIERVDAKLRPTGHFGSPRTLAKAAILSVLVRRPGLHPWHDHHGDGPCAACVRL